MKQIFKVAALSITLALLALSITSAIIPPTEDFIPSNPYWNGLETFTKAINAKPGDPTLQTIIPEKTALFVIAPSKEKAKQHIEFWREFAMNGGTLILMDETEAVNSILEALGINIRVDGHPMLDSVFYYSSWRIPKITNIESSWLTKNVNYIAMNLPSVLNLSSPTYGLKIIAQSSSFSFLDLDGDGKPSNGEPTGPFPVAAEAPYGKGRVIIFSDSSIFINSIITLGDNENLLHNIVGNRVVFVDTNVWRKNLHLTYRSIILSIYAMLSAPELKYNLTIITIILIYTLTHRRANIKADKEENIDTILSKHPSWDKRILQALKEARKKVAG